MRGIRTGSCLCVVLIAAGCGPSFRNTANLDSRGTNIVCLGDSITRGYGASGGKDYPSQLSALIGRPVINAGVDGDTTTDALRRLEADVLEQDPWIVIVELGGNDLLRKVPESTTRDNLSEITRQCVARGAIVVLVHAKFGILMSDPYLDTFEAVADEHGAVLIRNSLKGVLGTPSRMSDQIHPNDSGYALLAERVSRVVGPLAAASESARN